ncbi:hypothetical protein [Nitratireductor sp. CH_MIT9313-5]|uniref:hypothetical protein n=1 Tax=Nitratireductor sp. CH_MIT9313-5 TaxID=3107764 RepID=UPI00300888BD
MNRVVTEIEFRLRLQRLLLQGDFAEVGCVTGPGRSGAVAAVYASHILRVPFIPFGSPAPDHLGRLLIVDTATQTGKTIRKAARRYRENNPLTLAAYQEPPRVMFWYEGRKPQSFRHERRNAA